MPALLLVVSVKVFAVEVVVVEVVVVVFAGVVIACVVVVSVGVQALGNSKSFLQDCPEQLTRTLMTFYTVSNFNFTVIYD